MEILSKSHFLEREEFYLQEMEKGKVFIYPTDTIYGIGCDATNALAVKKIREIKMRDKKPFSVIAPSKDWIKENCVISFLAKPWIEKLPGRYTLILRLKNPGEVARKELLGDLYTLGVRIPNNWFSKVIEKFGKPFVTTSVNLEGEDYMTSLQELDVNIRAKIDYVIDEGKLENLPSKIVDLTNGEKIIPRH